MDSGQKAAIRGGTDPGNGITARKGTEADRDQRIGRKWL